MHSTRSAIALLIAWSTAVGAQSLGELAAVEAIRRGRIPQPVRVLTTGDLPSSNTPPTRPSTTPSAAPAIFPDGLGAGRRLVSPPKLRLSVSPTMPITAIAGGEVQLELDVSSNGDVDGVQVLRAPVLSLI